MLVLDDFAVWTSAGLDPQEQRAIGDYWFDASLSVALRVQSAVVLGEFNYLLNPLHLEFAQIAVSIPVLFCFDERLFGDK